MVYRTVASEEDREHVMTELKKLDKDAEASEFSPLTRSSSVAKARSTSSRSSSRSLSKGIIGGRDSAPFAK